MPKLRKLSLTILNPTSNTWEILDREFSAIEGVTAPRLDQESWVFELTYDPDIISQLEILTKLSALEYDYTELQDSLV